MNDLTTTGGFLPITTPIVLPTVDREERKETRPEIATTHVLHVINGEHYAGAERVQDLLALHLREFGFDIGFACLKPGRFPEVRESQEAPLHRLGMHGRFDLRPVAALVDLIHTHRYALVHAHTPRSALIASLAARRAGVPMVYHVHSPAGKDSTRRWQNWINARLEKWSIRGAAQLVTVSPSLKRLMRQQGFTGEQVTYVPNGVPACKGCEPRPRPTGPWTLGMTALFRPRKGIEVLLESLAMLRSRGADVRLRAIGPFETPEYEASIMRLASQLGLDEAIDWTGFVQDVPAELRQVDLLVLPSLFGEGLPMVVLEAMAAGVPVVASRVEGIPEAIRHREEGMLVEPGSVSQLAAAVEEVVSNDQDYEQLSANAIARHAECFSATAMAADVANVYRQVLGH